MFFLLSGVSMALAYRHMALTVADVARFAIRRVFRIWPLLWLAVGVVTVTRMVGGTPVDWLQVVANLTTAFGFVSPAAYINTGAWSIGNEVVYYALTPLILLAFARGRRSGNVVVGLGVLVGAWWAVAMLDGGSTLAAQWSTYVNPFNNLGLYTLGFALVMNDVSRATLPRAAWPLLVGGALLLTLWPSGSDAITLVTGTSRPVFTVAALAIVTAALVADVGDEGLTGRVLGFLGRVSYSTYLLHPIVLGAVDRVVARAGLQLPGTAIAAIVIAVTFAASAMVFRLVEEPAIRVGKRVADLISGRAR
jgi:peptidoglycan/LPS O-acetylase OafA/YrhL